MSARYAFYRDPTGRPYKRDDGKHAPTHLLAAMGKCSVASADETIAWKSGRVDFDTLRSSIVIVDSDGEELNEQDRNHLVWQGLADTAKRDIGQPLKAKDVLSACDARAAAFFRRPLNDYALLTSLSLGSFPAKSIKVRGSVVRPYPARPSNFVLPKVLQSRHHGGRFADHLNGTTYLWVTISTRGRTITEGLNLALDNLSLLRALWSFGITLNRRTMSFFSSDRRRLGVIHAGPLQTLHLLDGRPATDDFYWYDPDFSGELPVFKNDKAWGQLEKDRKWALGRLRRLPYGNDLRLLLIRYLAALDQINPNVAFLQLWAILEKLTNTVGANYDETIKRTSWIFEDDYRLEIKETLEILRHHRNRTVHAGNMSFENSETAALLKTIVDPHLVRLLNNTFHVGSLAEYGERLSLPAGIKDLERLRSWTARALRAIRKESKLK